MSKKSYSPREMSLDDSAVNEAESLLKNDILDKTTGIPLSSDMPKKKRSTLSLASVAYALLMGNVEYAIVMPSLWLYLQHLDPTVPEYYFGFLLGAFNFAAMLSSPVFGYWLDRRPMKEVMVFCMVVGAVGNSLYALAPNIWVVLLGRIISGIGGNIYNTGMTYVVRVSEPEERSALYAKINLIFYMGMLFGPALNYPLSLLGRYQFGLFTVEPLNAPGFLMVFMLSLAVLFIHLAFEEPMHIDELTGKHEAVDPIRAARDKKCCGLAKYKPLVTSFTLMTVIGMQFAVQFDQICMETIVTPVTKAWYGYGQLENSIIYAIITVIFFLWFFSIIFISKKMQDRTLIVLGLFWFGAASIFSVVVFYTSQLPDVYVMPLWQFGLAVSALVSGIPFFLSSMGSLFSKLVNDKRIQGMGQSMLSAATSLANIVGPIVSGAILPRVDVVFAMFLGIWAFILCLVVLRWNALYTDSTGKMRQIDDQLSEAEDKDEEQPPIGGGLDTSNIREVAPLLAAEEPESKTTAAVN